MKFISVYVVLFAVVSCDLLTDKDAYLNKYGLFITEIAEIYKTANKKEWEKHVRKYNNFNGEWYNRFKNDFTLKEKIVITSYQAKFNYYRALRHTNSSVKELLETLNVDEIKNQIQYYIDNDMHDDIEKLYKEARKTGKDIEKNVSTILHELKINIEKWKNDD